MPAPSTRSKCQVSLLASLVDAFKEWKQRTFRAIAEQMDRDTITNIVAVGDSQIEIDAATNMAR